jgi:putative ABC transport system permease protein
MASRNILTDVLLQGLTIAGIGVGAGVAFGIVFARGIGRYVAEVHLPGMLTLVASAFVILAAAVIASAVPAALAAPVNAVEALRSE